ncbi:GxxExxY protein [Algoriphagus sp. 4150]|uniref:GxxExxY protein n=1 Tax=Algoriphagus sp. 4150 TaxID=2817756 RepID=UPI002862587F|nr:GxxExxY protein [Algoriphagus sp. 4150]MDR7129986.1 GxxExxY protein [Algoriphagus sp. 4150]
MTQKKLDELTYKINGAAIEVHKHVGPGLLESVYHKCLAEELRQRNILFHQEIRIPILYKGISVTADLRVDFFIEENVIVEIKSVSEILPIHQAQLMTYMKLMKAPKGILLNFNVVNLYHEGQKTFVNNYFSNLDRG